jgi:phytoene dehydrogenase-like protein
MEEIFDAIIIGGGHNGQILAAYLKKAGLSTLVLERRMEPGGGLCTEEITVPGFYHNLHSFFGCRIFRGTGIWSWNISEFA